MSANLTFIRKLGLAGSGVNCVGLLFLLLLCCRFLYGQTNESPRARRDSYSASDAALSDLAKENLDLVAASSIQIREILLKDAGLLVELKRWIAKEASDNGQVVRESNLTEEAIFERLDRDLTFRSVATRLLQRYGYLLPAPNPDSSLAKEQDFVLKERARRLVAIEAQEDAEALRPGRNNRDEADVERTGTCDGQQDRGCEKARGSRTQTPSSPGNESPVPDAAPDMTSQPTPSRTLRTGVVQSTVDGQAGSSAEFELTSKSDAPFASQNPNPFSTDGLTAFNKNPLYADTSGALFPQLLPRNEISEDQSFRANRTANPQTNRRPSAGQFEEDATAVKMVRQANPYADVPSLYDMYVQAAASQ